MEVIAGHRGTGVAGIARPTKVHRARPVDGIRARYERIRNARVYYGKQRAQLIAPTQR